MQRAFERILGQVESDVGNQGHKHILVVHSEPHESLLPSKPSNPVERENHVGLTYTVRLPPGINQFGPLVQSMQRFFDPAFSKLKPTLLLDSEKSLPRKFDRQIYREGDAPGFMTRSGYDVQIHFNVPNGKLQAVVDAFTHVHGLERFAVSGETEITRIYPGAETKNA